MRRVEGAKEMSCPLLTVPFSRAQARACDRLMRACSILSSQTPVVELSKFDTGPCRLFIKLENQNPGGSIKDRIALSMNDDAERPGRLMAGGTIIKATAGNTGLWLTQVGIPRGYNTERRSFPRSPRLLHTRPAEALPSYTPSSP